MGGTSGIGLKSVEILVEKGHMVGVAGRKDDVLRGLEERFPGKIVTEKIDITSPEAPQGLHRLIGRLGGMDCYFHVAGVGFENDRLATDRELKTLHTNVTGFTQMLDTAFRYFRDENGGRGQIAAITSIAGTNGIGRLTAYSSSKTFQQTYLRALNQLAAIQHLSISFTDIRPGWVRTPLLDPNEKYPLLMSDSYAARRVVRALLHRRRVAVVDWRWNIIVGLWRLIPNALWVRLPIPINTL